MFLPNRKRSKNNATAVQSKNSTICLHKQNFKQSSSKKEQIVRQINISSIQRYIGFISLKGNKNRSGARGREKCRCQREERNSCDPFLIPLHTCFVLKDNFLNEHLAMPSPHK
jgi:hypothetical protein